MGQPTLARTPPSPPCSDGRTRQRLDLAARKLTQHLAVKVRQLQQGGRALRAPAHAGGALGRQGHRLWLAGGDSGRGGGGTGADGQQGWWCNGGGWRRGRRERRSRAAAAHSTVRRSSAAEAHLHHALHHLDAAHGRREPAVAGLRRRAGAKGGQSATFDQDREPASAAVPPRTAAVGGRAPSTRAWRPSQPPPTPAAPRSPPRGSWSCPAAPPAWAAPWSAESRGPS